ncbi:MAG: hypothetical protein ACOZIN_17650, partial [Myxococcota bacterium]
MRLVGGKYLETPHQLVASVEQVLSAGFAYTPARLAQQIEDLPVLRGNCDAYAHSRQVIAKQPAENCRQTGHPSVLGDFATQAID